MTVVKICGIMDVPHGLAAIDAGAEYLGFVFYPPSSRFLSVKVAAQLIADLRAKRPTGWQAVGVFVNEPLDVVERTRIAARLDVVQLNGEETPEYIRQIEAPVFKALRGTESADPTVSAEALGAQRLLIDANVPGRYGGTGVTIDWARVGPMVAHGFLAGGLTPENVAEAIRAARPWGLDVSSGVERNGVKSAELIERFIHNAQAVHA
jgi:phosphoribosylanthranilate isomerase